MVDSNSVLRACFTGSQRTQGSDLAELCLRRLLALYGDAAYSSHACTGFDRCFAAGPAAGLHRHLLSMCALPYQLLARASAHHECCMRSKEVHTRVLPSWCLPSREDRGYTAAEFKFERRPPRDRTRASYASISLEPCHVRARGDE